MSRAQAAPSTDVLGNTTDHRPDLVSFASQATARLRDTDRRLYDLLTSEAARQSRTLMMVAASSVADPSVLACGASTLTNLTTEGYPSSRYHAGCTVADEIEQLAIDRARAVFSARDALVQPH